MIRIPRLWEPPRQAIWMPRNPGRGLEYGPFFGRPFWELAFEGGEYWYSQEFRHLTEQDRVVTHNPCREVSLGVEPQPALEFSERFSSDPPWTETGRGISSYRYCHVQIFDDGSVKKK